MNKSIKRIHGKIVFEKTEGGFWGIVAEDKYLPVNFPEQLKCKDADVSCLVDVDPNMVTMHMWGTACRIISFSTFN